MHDGKDAGAAEIVAAGGDRVGEQPADVGVGAEAGGGTGGDDAVDLAAGQHCRQGGVGGGVLDSDVGGQVQRGFLDGAGLVQPGAHPGDVGCLDPVFVVQDRP